MTIDTGSMTRIFDKTEKDLNFKDKLLASETDFLY